MSDFTEPRGYYYATTAETAPLTDRVGLLGYVTSDGEFIPADTDSHRPATTDGLNRLLDDVLNEMPDDDEPDLTDDFEDPDHNAPTDY